MGALKAAVGFLFSRRLWTFVGLALLCALIWFYGPFLNVNGIEPFASALVRGIAIGAIVLLWLLSILLRQIRALRANQAFVTELARPAPTPARPGERAVDEINTKFQAIVAQMKRSKVGNRRFLREMPWYVIIGPPGTGKTTALRQSGLKFPVDLADDLKGVGGTRNCDWFFTDDAVLVDTAGRYTEQGSDPEADAVEWQGFLDLLKKHRGRRALNGVIVAISLRELLGPTDELRRIGREIRKRLSELRERLEIHLPVYLVITKTDLLPGFEAFFADLATQDREQVWGATLPLDATAEGGLVERELAALAQRAERRLTSRLADEMPLAQRAEVFRFPAQLLTIEAPVRQLVETVFGETRFDDASWLRGFYLTSATQEGSPIDRLMVELGRGFGLPVQPPAPRRHGERRSFFLRRLLSDVIFREAGLGLFDPRAEERRKWIWRGTLAGSTLAVALLATLFAFSYVRYAAALDEQGQRLFALRDALEQTGARQASTEDLDLDDALARADDVDAAEVRVARGPFTLLGPRADGELALVHDIAYERNLSNILVPRMVALLEQTMLSKSGDPEFLLGALRTYNFLTDASGADGGFVREWWGTTLPLATTERMRGFLEGAALEHQIAAFGLVPRGDERIDRDEPLVAAALETVCTIPLAKRAYDALMGDSAVIGLPEWTPADVAGPNAQTVLDRVSGKTLRVGIPGAFTHAGFHEVILPSVRDVAARALEEGLILAQDCRENPEVDFEVLETDILTLYEQDYIEKWDAFIQDIRLAPIPDLDSATLHVKDLGTPESALTRLLDAVVRETDLLRSPGEAPAEGGAVPEAVQQGFFKRLLKMVGLSPKLAAHVALPQGESGAAAGPRGQTVASHFEDLKTLVQEVDGQPPRLDEVTAAFAELATALQTVNATDDPERTLQEMGGLTELTGPIVDIGRTLPVPIDAWVVGVAQDANTLAREAVIGQLNDRLRTDVFDFCREATGGRYPFDEASRIDVQPDDFGRLFRPGGLFDTYTEEQLSRFIDTTTRPWQWSADLDMPSESLRPFEQARDIRDALFPGGTGPLLSFRLLATDLSENAGRVTLDVDGTPLLYYHAAAQPVAMTWPGPNGAYFISLTFHPIGPASPELVTETGEWGILRLLRKGQLQRSADRDEVYDLVLAQGGFSARFELIADSIANPFDLTMFRGFRCPESL